LYIRAPDLDTLQVPCEAALKAFNTDVPVGGQLQLVSIMTGFFFWKSRKSVAQRHIRSAFL